MSLINLIKQQIQQISNNSNDSTVPRRIIVQGKAGTGKSLIIRTATKLIEETLGRDGFVILASAGIAALNIGGQTIHSYFSVPKDSKSFKDLNGESARNLTSKMSSLKFIIVDEFSMIGCVLLAMMEERCCQGTGNIHDYFGGLYIIFLGDIRQLPPVLDSPLYSRRQKSALCQYGKAVFLSFEKSFFLFQCHRQLDPVFQTMLDNISVGSITVDEFNLLSTRFSNLCSTEITNKKVLRIFSTIEQVNGYNLYMLNTAKDEHGQLLPVARVPANHNCKLASRAKPEHADGLEPVLYISRGCKIMLRHNLWTNRGLVNGVVGTVLDILYEQDSSSPENLPSILLCSFHSYKGPSVISEKNVISITPVTASWTTTNGIKCTRTQFPVSVAYACYIHKSQGMTLDKVVVDIGRREFALGLTYVGLSRVKTLEGLFLIPFCFDRIANLKSRDGMLQRTDCEKWLRTLQ